MIVRLGIPASFERFSAAAKDMGAGVLISANALRRRSGGFRHPPANLFSGCDVALDSAGFVAMVRYRGYPWTVAQYVQLAKSHPWAWWAAMDFCCEREVAPNREEVLRRVHATVSQLGVCRQVAADHDLKPPMPVVQGWEPSDYLRCLDLMGADLPDLIGVGSVCRRELGGRDGLLNIVARLDGALPAHTKLHLFGVKGSALRELAGHPRIHSTDSMAWDAAARREKGERACSIPYRIEHMRRWYFSNIALLAEPAQRRLFA